MNLVAHIHLVRSQRRVIGSLSDAFIRSSKALK